MKPLPRRGEISLQRVAEMVKNSEDKSLSATEKEEIRIVQKMFLHDGMRGFNLQIVPESFSNKSRSWSYEQQFSSEMEMNKKDQCSEEFSKQKSFKGNLGIGFSGFEAKLGG